jgi:hypothetical protein
VLGNAKAIKCMISAAEGIMFGLEITGIYPRATGQAISTIFIAIGYWPFANKK